MDRLAPVNSHALRRASQRESAGWLRPVGVALSMLPVALTIAALVDVGPSLSFFDPLEASLRQQGLQSPMVPKVGPLDEGVPQSAVIRARDGTVLRRSTIGISEDGIRSRSARSRAP